MAFLIPTEIFPSEMSAQENGFGITGWAVGVGWTVLVNPIMFGIIKSRTYFLFAAFNLMWIPIVYFFYPESKDRSLEGIEALFSAKSPFYWAMEKSHRENGDILAAQGGKEAVEREMSVISMSSEKERKASLDV